MLLRTVYHAGASRKDNMLTVFICRIVRAGAQIMMIRVIPLKEFEINQYQTVLILLSITNHV